LTNGTTQYPCFAGSCSQRAADLLLLRDYPAGCKVALQAVARKLTRINVADVRMRAIAMHGMEAARELWW
jgi:hypothetical protein